jgi:UDP-2,4-diacetamido-2,4,6-trideoxy-beta-L-altropyranose hydrolase
VTSHDEWLGADWATDARHTVDAWPDVHAQWLVVDHYALEAGWERASRTCASRLLVIDDLADRAHDCDVLIDQNVGRKALDYTGQVPHDCDVLAGPAFALLRAQFVKERAASLQRRRAATLKRLLISMGGMDTSDVTSAVLGGLNICEGLAPSLEIVIAMGSHSPALAKVQQTARALPWCTKVLVDVDDMASLMRDSDLAIGAAGSTALERCCVGLPSIVVALAPNQERILQSLQDAGAVIAVNPPSGPDGDGSFKAALAQAVAVTRTPWQLRELSDRSAALVDGLGTERVADAMACRMRRA